MKTLYDLLGVNPDATHAQVEQGYKRCLDNYLARQGVGKPDEETRRMQMIRDAYLLLCSPQRRQSYDQQLQLYEKARTQILSRSNRKFAIWLMIIVMAVATGFYVHKVLHVGANPSAQQLQEQSTANGFNSTTVNTSHRSEVPEQSQQVARSN
ncbi:MAG TPA: DnaJ domain-containing protein [Burkholderiaceae bacterium]|jgi:DnaJ-class molecular chaperone|nr:DnaJ domain-containing protein [Burkholderiaceae bacterium]